MLSSGNGVEAELHLVEDKAGPLHLGHGEYQLGATRSLRSQVLVEATKLRKPVFQFYVLYT